MRIHRLIAIFFAFFIVILFPLINLYILGVWPVFSQMYLILALFFIWFILILRMIVDFKQPRQFIWKNDVGYTVIVPVYNEDPELLEAAVKSIKESYGKKQIIIINDGSTKKETNDKIQQFKNDKDILVLGYLKNKGKKFAQVEGIDNAKYDYIISVDSDTIVTKYALFMLISPIIEDKTIGITNPNVEIINKNTNLLTKMQQLQTYGAFMVGRKSLGGFGIMNCASGIAMGFRKSDFLELKEKYLGKRVFGFDCIFGEDRWLTNLILKKGLKVIMIEQAVVYTYVPENFMHYAKQQLRWKISGIIEGIHEITFSGNRPVFFIYSILNWILPFLCITLIITLVATHMMLLNISGLITFVLITIAATTVRDVLIIIEKPQLTKYIVPYSLLNLFLLQWLWVLALFRIDEQTWITR